MTQRPTAALQVVPAGAPAALDPRWDRARELVERVRSGGRAWLELREVLTALREQYFSKGGRPSKNPPHGAASFADERGWQAKVREQLDISDDTARRWLLDGQRYGQMRLIDNGKIHEVEGHKITDAVRAEVRAALAEIDADPTVRPARKWAGLWSAVKTKGSQRAPIDHAMNISNAIAKLKTSLPHWRDLDPHDRADVEAEFNAMKHLLEGTLL